MRKAFGCPWAPLPGPASLQFNFSRSQVAPAAPSPPPSAPFARLWGPRSLLSLPGPRSPPAPGPAQPQGPAPLPHRPRSISPQPPPQTQLPTLPRRPRRAPRPLTMNLSAFSCRTASAGSIVLRGRAGAAPPAQWRPQPAQTGTCATPRPPQPRPAARTAHAPLRRPTGNGVPGRVPGKGPECWGKPQIPAGSGIGGTLGAGWRMRCMQCRGPTGVVVAWGSDGAGRGPGWMDAEGGGWGDASRRCRVGFSSSTPSLGWKARLAPESQPRARHRPCSSRLVLVKLQLSPVHWVQKMSRGWKQEDLGWIKWADIIVERCLFEAILYIKSLPWCFGGLFPIKFLDQFSLENCTKQQKEKRIDQHALTSSCT